MFKVGMFKVHPDIPENLSVPAKEFLQKYILNYIYKVFPLINIKLL